MVDTEERGAWAGGELSPHFEERLRAALAMAAEEDFETPPVEEVERVRSFLARVETLSMEIAANTWVSVGVDGRFGFVTTRPGFRVNYETADDGLFNLGVVNESNGTMWAREGVDELAIVSELEHPRA